MSSTKKKLIINKKSTIKSKKDTKRVINKMILLEDTIRVLKDLVYNHTKESSGILEVNELNVADIAGLLISGKETISRLSLGNIVFHTHTIYKRNKYYPPSPPDFKVAVYDYYIDNYIKNSLIIAPEGIYTYNLTNKFIKELDNIKDRKISINKFSQLYSELYEKYTTMYFMYQFKKKESIKDYKKWFQDGKIDKEYYKFMIKFAQNGITEVKYGEIMKDLGCDLKLYKWDDKRMDIKLLKGTEVTNKILSFQDKKEVDKFRKDCSKQQLKD